MIISTKGRYALHLMLDLAENQNGEYIALKDIAARQEISKKYLEQIVSALTKADLLKAGRGTQGGYMLAKAPEEYTIGEILRLTEGSLAPVACIDNNSEPCEKSSMCVTLPVWQGLNKVINDYLDSITLQNLLDQHYEVNAKHYVI